MKITVNRSYKGDTYTIGKLYLNDKYFCDVLEDTDRGLTQSMPLSMIKSKKISAKTAIPSGTYNVTLDIISPKYSKSHYYMNLCKGKVPRLLDVPGFEGILIHTGNTAEDTEGCLIVGENKIKGKVINSKIIFEKLYKELLKDKDNLIIEIK